jgi:hypothetical protein
VNLVFFLQVPLVALACRLVSFNRRFGVAEYLELPAYTSGLHMLVYSAVVIPGWYLLRGNPKLAATLYNAYIPCGRCISATPVRGSMRRSAGERGRLSQRAATPAVPGSASAIIRR